MARRKSVVQVNFRLRQDILRKLEREAKRNDRSTNDEIVRRIENSLTYDDWREKREDLLVFMRDKLGDHLDVLQIDHPTTEEVVEKPRGTRLIQARFRLRDDILEKLEREAKRHIRSTNDEIGSRLQESFNYGDWWQDWWRELMMLINALIIDVASHESPMVETKAAYAKLVKAADRDIWHEIKAELATRQG
jgi:hypothetical protein